MFTTNEASITLKAFFSVVRHIDNDSLLILKTTNDSIHDGVII